MSIVFLLVRVHLCFCLQNAGLKVKINQVREELQKSMLNLDFEKAQLQKNELLDLEAHLSQPCQANPSQSTEEVDQPSFNTTIQNY